ncbi:VOC family protein [Mycobacterium deserti]|uniref:VOC family protein n=1 Tax=Mycobacterium deserti TaxID=2978347 RepID=A0ABT2MHT2_9MYCO|nr:VOC family protein [Mycobacterium deserti]MCT7661844.1 VOC family protein [Mycobacterium deserti]
MTVNDICAVVAASDYDRALAWYTRILGRGPDLEPIDGVAEWQLTATAWLQLIEDADRAGRSAVRFGVDDLAAQIASLNELGVPTGEPVVIADMVRVLDIADSEGNEVSYVEDITPTGTANAAEG